MNQSHQVAGAGAPMVLASGSVLAEKYELLRLVGQGGMGEVWSARHRSLGEDVAIKFLVAPSLSDPDAMLSRFQLEARIAAHLSRKTRHIASVIDYGVARGGNAYLVMELLDGASLETIIRGGMHRDLGFVSMIVDQLAKGLSVAHASGVVHRDLKPQNVMLTRGDEPGIPLVKILDFGLGKLDEGPTAPSFASAGSGAGTKRHATLAGAPLGTPDYMSPEQVRGVTDLDGRCDVWALGVVAYQLLTGACPFEGESITDTMFRVLSGTREPILSRRPDLPESTRAVFARAFAPRIEDRFHSAQSFADALRALADDEAAEKSSVSKSTLAGVSRPPFGCELAVERRPRRTRDVLSAVIGIVFALSLGVLLPRAPLAAAAMPAAMGASVRFAPGEDSVDVPAPALAASSRATSSAAPAASASASHAAIPDAWLVVEARPVVAPVLAPKRATSKAIAAKPRSAPRASKVADEEVPYP